MSAHTPGPWRLDDRAMHDEKLFVDSYHMVDAGAGYAPHGFHIAAHINEADVRLVCAAPDLLAACEGAVEELRTDENYVSDNGAEAEFLVKLRAAIAKARGQ